MSEFDDIGVPGINLDPHELTEEQVRIFITETRDQLQLRLGDLQKACGRKKIEAGIDEAHISDICEDIARLSSLLAYALSDRQRPGAKITASLALVMMNLINLTQDRDELLRVAPKIWLPPATA